MTIHTTEEKRHLVTDLLRFLDKKARERRDGGRFYHAVQKDGFVDTPWLRADDIAHYRADNPGVTLVPLK